MESFKNKLKLIYFLFHIPHNYIITVTSEKYNRRVWKWINYSVIMIKWVLIITSFVQLKLVIMTNFIKSLNKNADSM